MLSSIDFKVPAAQIADLARICVEFGGNIEFESPDNEVTATALLEAHVGQKITIEFSSGEYDSPLKPAEAIADILDAENSPYVLLCDAFVEPARGERIVGRVAVNFGDGRQEWKVPWEHGEPLFDKHTLIASGMNPNAAIELLDRWTAI